MSTRTDKKKISRNQRPVLSPSVHLLPTLIAARRNDINSKWNRHRRKKKYKYDAVSHARKKEDMSGSSYSSWGSVYADPLRVSDTHCVSSLAAVSALAFSFSSSASAASAAARELSLTSTALSLAENASCNSFSADADISC